MTKSTITREQLLEIIETDHVQCGEASYLARMALAAMDQKPALHRYRRKAVEPYGPYPWHYEVFVDYPQPFEDIEDEYFYAAPPVVTGFAVDGESERLPLDYLQGHKDGLEWAAQLAEANHPETGDWLYDDPIELAKAIRKGPDMPPVQPVADSEPVAEITEDLGRLFVKIHYPTTLRAGDKLYRHAQPAPVVPDAATAIRACLSEFPESARDIVEECADIAENACRAAMLQAEPVCTCPSGDGSLRWPCPVHPGNSPAQSDCCQAQNHVSPEQNSVAPAQSPIDHGYRPECKCSGCKTTSRICAELSANSPANPNCWCRTCRPVVLNDMRFVVCPDCGNKRCPRANDHRNACTGSNEPGQEGSAYPDTSREVKGE
ncbi:TPA: hypothetical protein ACXEY4_000009 [Klebsiella pneumoniae]